jgi:hypothetical protein
MIMFEKLELEMKNPMIQHATKVSDITETISEEEGIYRRTVVFKTGYNHMVILQAEDGYLGEDGLKNEIFTGITVPRQMIPDILLGFDGVKADDPY